MTIVFESVGWLKEGLEVERPVRVRRQEGGGWKEPWASEPRFPHMEDELVEVTAVRITRYVGKVQRDEVAPRRRPSVS